MGDGDEHSDASTLSGEHAPDQGEEGPKPPAASRGARRMSTLQLNERRNDALGLAEVIELQDHALELERQVLKWQDERRELEKQLEGLNPNQQPSDTEETRRNLANALGLIVRLVGKDEMERLMTTGDDSRVMKSLQQRVAHNR